MAGRKRQPTQFRREQVPDYVKTSDSREKSLLATSPAVMKSMESRRGTPLIVPDTVKVFGMHRLSVAESEDLRIDTRYQRDEVTNEVNDLIVVLKKGGVIPDPISVAERKYGDRKRYIVDGQQRWWAHVDTGTPIQAIIYHVNSFEDEVALFHALNTVTRVTPETRLRSLPGPAGEALRKLNEQQGSALYQKITFTPGGGQFGAMIVLRGMTALLSNTKTNGGLDRVAPVFDRYYRMNPKVAEKMVEYYTTLIGLVFEDQRLNSVAAVALGRMAYAAFLHGGELPSGQQLRRLKSLKWEGLSPTHAMKWLPTVVAAVQDIWPVQLVQEQK